MSMSKSINILPSFVTYSKGKFACSCNDCNKDTTMLSSFSDLQNHLKSIKWFQCPEDDCKHTIPTISVIIKNHINECHTGLAEFLEFKSSNAFYCKICNIYTTFKHFHCNDCKKETHITVDGETFTNRIYEKSIFKNKDELDSHLKNDHSKWWLEKSCRDGTKCSRFKSGKCAFNHLEHPESYISNTSDIPQGICRYDKPWVKSDLGPNVSRCKNTTCRYDHFWGHVRFVIKKNNSLKLKMKSKSDSESDSESDYESESDSESKSK